MIWINRVSWNKIWAKLIATVDMVKIIVISCFLVKNCHPDIFRKRQEEYLTLFCCFFLCSRISCMPESVHSSVNCQTLVFQIYLISKDTICKMSVVLICNDWIRENELITSCYWKSIVYKLQRKLTRIQCTGDFKMLFRAHWFVSLGFKCKNLQCGVVFERWCNTRHIKCLHTLAGVVYSNI